MLVGSSRVWLVLITVSFPSAECGRVLQNSTRSRACKAVFRPLLLIQCLKKLARAPTNTLQTGIYYCEWVSREEVQALSRGYVGGTYVSLAWIFMDWGGSSLRSAALSCAHYFQAPATQARRKPCLCRHFAFVVALVFVAFADLSTLTIQLLVFLTFLTAPWQHSQSHVFWRKIILKWNEMLPCWIKWKIQWGILMPVQALLRLVYKRFGHDQLALFPAETTYLLLYM